MVSRTVLKVGAAEHQRQLVVDGRPEFIVSEKPHCATHELLPGARLSKIVGSDRTHRPGEVGPEGKVVRARQIDRIIEQCDGTSRLIDAQLEDGREEDRLYCPVR